MSSNYMVINGERFPVINSWIDVESPSDGRRRWGIVTEAGSPEPETAAAPAPVAPAPRPGHSWVNGTGLRLSIDSPFGPVYLQELYMVALIARGFGPEIMRYTYDWADPETGAIIRGAGRLVYEELPDPRAEEQPTQQPAAPAGATACTHEGCGQGPDAPVHMTPTDLVKGHLYQRRVGMTPADVIGAIREIKPFGPPFPGFPAENEMARAQVSAECLGDACTGCSDPQCWTVHADGGDA